MKPRFHSKITTLKPPRPFVAPRITKREAALKLYAVRLTPEPSDTPELITFRKTPEVSWRREFVLNHVRPLIDEEGREFFRINWRTKVVGECAYFEVALRYADYIHYLFGLPGDYNLSQAQAEHDFVEVRPFTDIINHWL